MRDQAVMESQNTRGTGIVALTSSFLFAAVKQWFWPTVLSVTPLAHGVVCLSSVCDVLYCGKTVHPSKKLSEGVNRKPVSKVDFLGRRHISTSGFASMATETAVFVLFLPIQPSDWY